MYETENPLIVLKIVHFFILRKYFPQFDLEKK